MFKNMVKISGISKIILDNISRKFAISKSKVIERAMLSYDYILDETSLGRKIAIIDENNNIIKYVEYK